MLAILPQELRTRALVHGTIVVLGEHQVTDQNNTTSQRVSKKLTCKTRGPFDPGKRQSKTPNLVNQYGNLPINVSLPFGELVGVMDLLEYRQCRHRNRPPGVADRLRRDEWAWVVLH